MISVVVVVHNSAAELAVLIDSLERHVPEVQLIVVDSGSSDAGAQLASERGAETLVLDGNPGFGAANNAGLDLARGEIVALLNPDIELLDDGLRALADYAAKHDALHAPTLLNPDGTRQRSAHLRPGMAISLLPALVPPAVMPRPLREHFEPWRATQGPLVVGWAIAAAVVVRTATLRRIGPFDPTTFMFNEDLELCLRAAQAGVPTVLHPDVRMRHVGMHSTLPAYRGEPHELFARRRREVVAAVLGRRALALDDAAQGIAFATRAVAHGFRARERTQLRALLGARRAQRRVLRP